MAQLTGDELFYYDGLAMNYSVSDFWRWSSSTLLSNTMRGILAEFIVARSLNIDTDSSRIEWDAYDLRYGKTRIEVKCSSYLQAWEQKNLSKINFSIAPHRSWTPEAGYSDEVCRHSDLYIFCLFSAKDRTTANPIMLEQWEFYLLPTSILDEHCGEQRTISLQSLLSLDPICCNYETLKTAVDASCEPRCKNI